MRTRWGIWPVAVLCNHDACGRRPVPKKRLERNLGGLNLSASSQHLPPSMSENLQLFFGNPQHVPTIWGLPTLETRTITDDICLLFSTFLPVAWKTFKRQENRSSSKGIQSVEFSRCTDLSFGILMRTWGRRKTFAWNPGPSGTDHSLGAENAKMKWCLGITNTFWFHRAQHIFILYVYMFLILFWNAWPKRSSFFFETVVLFVESTKPYFLRSLGSRIPGVFRYE